MSTDYANISEILINVMRDRKVSVEALSNATDIPKRFIDSLISGDFGNLPAKPYVRGYLFKIAEALRIDENSLWQSYKSSASLTTSGEHDRLPSNRFAFKKMRASRMAAIFLVIVVLAFLGFRFNDILGKPDIDVSLPESTTEETIIVSGNVKSGDTLTLNDEVIYPDGEGFFEKRVQLEPGLNTLEFRVKRYLGRESSLTKQVFYNPEITPTQPEEQVE